MYNPNNLKRFKSDRAMNIMVHLAGVTGNLIVGLIGSAFLGVFTILNYKYDHVILMTMTMLFAYIVMFSLGLLAFNLLPIPPLDGFHVFEELLPYKVKMSNGYMQFQRMAPMILMVVFIASSFGRIPILSNLVEIIETPFSYLCNLVSALFGYLTSLVV